jgi:hypothetical protein
MPVFVEEDLGLAIYRVANKRSHERHKMVANPASHYLIVLVAEKNVEFVAQSWCSRANGFHQSIA